MLRTTDEGATEHLYCPLLVGMEEIFLRLSCAMVAGIDEGIGKIVEVLQSQVQKPTSSPVAKDPE